MLLREQDDVWLQTMRALHWQPSRDGALLSGATGTRAGPGNPIRWSQSWVGRLKNARGVENMERNKRLTKTRAAFVREEFL